MLETLDFTIRIGSTPTFLYFNFYINIRLFIYIYIYLYPLLCAWWDFFDQLSIVFRLLLWISFVGFGTEILANYSYISRLTYDDVNFSSIYVV